MRTCLRPVVRYGVWSFLTADICVNVKKVHICEDIKAEYDICFDPR